MMPFCVVFGVGAKRERNSMGPRLECHLIRLFKKSILLSTQASNPAELAPPVLGAMSKTLALDFGCALRTTSALAALGFFQAVLPTLLSRWQPVDKGQGLQVHIKVVA